MRGNVAPKAIQPGYHMNKIVSLIGICFVLFSCNNLGSQNSTDQQTAAQDINSSVGRNNYAVVWEWLTKDLELVKENTGLFTTELIALWTNEDIENVYFNTEAGLDTEMPFPTISFFIQAFSPGDAQALLDSLSIVKKQIASYTLHPVGMLWLGQNQETSDINSTSESFVSIWETKDKRPVDALTKSQNDAVLALWNEGKIENVYFDIEGTTKANKKTDFVFYIRAPNITEANSICESLPFFRESMASYQIFPAGTFWLGSYDETVK